MNKKYPRTRFPGYEPGELPADGLYYVSYADEGNGYRLRATWQESRPAEPATVPPAETTEYGEADWAASQHPLRPDLRGLGRHRKPEAVRPVAPSWSAIVLSVALSLAAGLAVVLGWVDVP